MNIEINADEIAAPDMHNDTWQVRVSKAREGQPPLLLRVHVSDPDMQKVAESAIGRKLKPQGKDESMLPDLRENWDAMKSPLETEIARRIAQKLGSS